MQFSALVIIRIYLFIFWAERHILMVSERWHVTHWSTFQKHIWIEAAILNSHSISQYLLFCHFFFFFFCTREFTKALTKHEHIQIINHYYIILLHIYSHKIFLCFSQCLLLCFFHASFCWHIIGFIPQPFLFPPKWSEKACSTS